MLLLIILVLGIIVQYSASSYLSTEKYNDPNYLIKQQILKILAALPLFFFFLFLDYRFLKRITYLFVFLSFILLVLCFVMNKGTIKRWITIGPIRIQPSEFSKLTLIIFISYYIDKYKESVSIDIKKFLFISSIIFITLFLIILQKDYSTSAAIFIICLTILFIGNVNLKNILILLGLFAISSLIFILIEPYRLSRVLLFISPEKGKADGNYQIMQSLISLGNGGLFGKGIGKSIEKNMYLPNPHTDFIFSVLGEEFGFIGTSIIMVLFLILFINCIRVSIKTDNTFGKLLGLGLSISIFMYFILNVAVVVNLLPVTGLPLPFISYGGSAMMYNLSAMAILINISKKIKAKEEKITLTVEYV